MLLFSTLLDLKDTFSEEQFVELVLKWNKETPMDVNRIPNLDWNGEWGTRFGSEDLWIQFDKYEKKNIVAVRYRMIYCGDSRYKVTLAKTPSDDRGSKNNVSEISKICF